MDQSFWGVDWSRALADSLFAQIEDSYLSLCAKVDSNAPRRKVFTGTDFKGTWYVPGGRNYLANFFRMPVWSIPGLRLINPPVWL
jgi:hypothetical protein